MAKRAKRRLGWLWFLLFMIVYAVAFLAVAKEGLEIFWNFIASYETSRPNKPIEAYMAELTPEHISDLSGDLIARIDHNIQSEEECRQIIEDAVSGNISYARNLKECTDTQTVYMLMCGGKTIGKVVTTAQPADEFGFSIWEVTDESFDLSYLIGEKITVTAPHNYPVLVNGQTLDESYITETGIHYELLADYYEEYTLPYIVTYEAGPFLGQPDYAITSPTGEPVTIDENTDWNVFIENCTQEQLDQVNAFLTDFLDSYVAFTSSRENRFTAYDDVITYMVPKGTLADRMKRALDGLQYNHVKKAYVVSITLHHCIDTGDGYYLCYLTYEAHVDKYDGGTIETNNLQLILKQTGDGPLAEAMTSY